MSRVRCALLVAILTSCMVHIGDVREAGTTGPGPNTRPKPGDCNMPEPAFCETFDAASPGGRGGDLDEKRWSVARVSNAVNPGQGMYLQWELPTATPCGRTASDPGQALAICSAHLEEAVIDYQLLSMRARQPFDFANRTGVIAFDVDTKSDASWIEVWITDEPVLGAQNDYLAAPRNALGFSFRGNNCGGDPAKSALTDLWVVKDRSSSDKGGSDCFSIKDGELAHIELRLAAHLIEVWASDAGQPASLRRIVQLLDVPLPLTRGYVQFENVSASGSKVFRWDNLAFDGPSLPAPRGYDLPDNSGPNLGYGLSSPTRIVVPGLDVSGARSARLDLNAWLFTSGSKLEYRVNGDLDHPWREVPPPSDTRSDARAVGADIPVNELVSGENTVDLRSTPDPIWPSVIVANPGISVDTAP